MKWGLKKTQKRVAPLSHSQQLYRLRENGVFYGVKIHGSSCESAAKCAGIVFPFEEAPKLPLENCEAAICSCKYMGVPDRRDSADRRTGADRRFSIRQTMDRRSGRDRRSEANTWKGFAL
jgi:hypothetical protein